MNTSHVDSYPHTKNINLGWLSPPMNPLLNTDVDPIIDILTDADLEKELSLYANAHFTFDTPPLLGMTRKKPIPCSNTPLGIYPQQQQHSSFQHHPPLTVDIPLALTTNDTCFTDPHSSTVSSPYDYQQQHKQHYFTPLPSLPGSPIHDNLEQSQLYSFMMHSPTEPPLHQTSSPSIQEALPSYEPSSPMMHRSGSAPTEQGTKKRRRTHSAQCIRQPSVDPDPITETTNDDDDQVAADVIRLDKRRRNTAASARFRIKKKMREQTLQRTACEMTEKARFFENKVHELEREIKWLKELLVAKNGFPC